MSSTSRECPAAVLQRKVTRCFYKICIITLLLTVSYLSMSLYVKLYVPDKNPSVPIMLLLVTIGCLAPFLVVAGKDFISHRRHPRETCLECQRFLDYLAWQKMTLDMNLVNYNVQRRLLELMSALELLKMRKTSRYWNNLVKLIRYNVADRLMVERGSADQVQMDTRMTVFSNEVHLSLLSTMIHDYFKLTVNNLTVVREVDARWMSVKCFESLLELSHLKLIHKCVFPEMTNDIRQEFALLERFLSAFPNLQELDIYCHSWDNCLLKIASVKNVKIECKAADPGTITKESFLHCRQGKAVESVEIFFEDYKFFAQFVDGQVLLDRRRSKRKPFFD